MATVHSCTNIFHLGSELVSRSFSGLSGCAARNLQDRTQGLQSQQSVRYIDLISTFRCVVPGLAYPLTCKKASWISGLNVKDAKGTALKWATDANTFVCSKVMPKGAATLETGNLYPTYYNNVIDTIELQVAKAGYRLAKWLDAIATNQSVKKRSVVHDEIAQGMEDLSGAYLLPKGPMSQAQRRREAMGYSCKH
ncbi:Putative S1/P1 nuclease, phospholipase C/P1 nuclease domain superfamily [Septoria linicola]|uniref:S1/P1 nuclease, phospholipase C/P1 nuclease domain superfamily n=1 Tax=Septoria linicola TaxID=215465 RepID=A0A9Q9B7W4_9PEZI|nr:Putative S1/P1 nuclease, phospholipase C/P1 nuclease domain superfamily [Septoria linicola]